MAQTVTIDAKLFNQLLKRIDTLTEDVQAIKTKLFEEEPPYGSDAWWDWSIKKGKEDVSAGRSTTVHSKQELQKLLDSLK